MSNSAFKIVVTGTGNESATKILESLDDVEEPISIEIHFEVRPEVYTSSAAPSAAPSASPGKSPLQVVIDKGRHGFGSWFLEVRKEAKEEGTYFRVPIYEGLYRMFSNLFDHPDYDPHNFPETEAVLSDDYYMRIEKGGHQVFFEHADELPILCATIDEFVTAYKAEIESLERHSGQWRHFVESWSADSKGPPQVSLDRLAINGNWLLTVDVGKGRFQVPFDDQLLSVWVWGKDGPIRCFEKMLATPGGDRIHIDKDRDFIRFIPFGSEEIHECRLSEFVEPFQEALAKARERGFLFLDEKSAPPGVVFAQDAFKRWVMYVTIGSKCACVSFNDQLASNWVWGKDGPKRCFETDLITSGHDYISIDKDRDYARFIPGSGGLYECRLSDFVGPFQEALAKAREQGFRFADETAPEPAAERAPELCALCRGKDHA